ncbi:MAG: trypsin-like peptidase domain-containing protein [Gemmatimonadaceae bacterium]
MKRFGRAQLYAAVFIAFASGLIFASGFDLTKISWAQQRSTATQPAPKPTPAEVKPLEEVGQAFEAIAEHVTPAVVSIEAEQLESRRIAQPRSRNIPPGMEEFFRNFEMPDPQPRGGTGSGFIVTKDGYILTNNHVVANADRVTVTMLDNRRFVAKVVGKDPTTDVAVIKVEASNLPTVTLGDDRKTRIGQWVVAIGNPLGLDFTVTAGIVSAKGRSQLNLPGRTAYAIQDFIQTDAAINPGNSGGPLVNIRGEVIGINSAIASPTGFNAGYGFAIPVTLAKQVMDDIVQFGRVRRAVLGVGIAEVEPADARAAGLSDISGVKIQGFDPPGNSPSEKAGIEVGDIIVAAAGQKVSRISELQRVIRGFKPGDVVDVDVMRFGQKKSYKVRLAEPPRQPDEQIASNERPDATPTRTGERTNERLGISVQPIPAELAQRVGTEYRGGLLVSEVAIRGPAYRELIAGRDIIVRALHPVKKEIRTTGDLESVVNALKRGDVLSLLVYDTAVGQTGSTKVVTLAIN